MTTFVNAGFLLRLKKLRGSELSGVQAIARSSPHARDYIVTVAEPERAQQLLEEVRLHSKRLRTKNRKIRKRSTNKKHRTA